ncbi:hypothetical protein [Jeongeupia naejangsanensis]|uniref:Glycoside hydrolase family 5 domain-containing protein n=1 Tax=Jeongeupia naejangsanensis TaxID=613195 RepID=A0ABS2BHP9_9NEIS|nr:hypothetical protein [Jeongeupia naejangsanensis]MBM3115139.1 hypothetical protein [Jeongeupia naejangsanensis]
MTRSFLKAACVLAMVQLLGCGKGQPGVGGTGSWLPSAVAAPLSTGPDGVFGVPQDWLTLSLPELAIQPGSALDFSGLFPGQKIDGPIRIDAAGHFVNNAGRVRFSCAGAGFGTPYGGFPDHDKALAYARQFRMAGYNLARFHFTDATLMFGRKLDFDYDPEQLDRFFFLLKALKDQGIYWYIDAMTSWNGAKGDVQPDRWVGKYTLKADVHVDPAAREHWLNLLKTLYGRVNPYTGATTLADDALAGVIQVNEGGLHFLSMVGQKIPLSVRPGLRAWLTQRYAADPDQFDDVWGQPYSAIADDTLALPDPVSSSPAMTDVLAYFSERERDTASWMSARLRELGYRGPITSYDNNPSLQGWLSRNQFDWVDLHAYHGEPTTFVTPGSVLANTSSLASRLRYFQLLAQNRIAGKPFTVTEYGQPFWSEWRREASLVMPAYAALQDWDALCQHANNPAELRYDRSDGWNVALRPYSIGYDPVSVIGERLTALLYRRGDLSPDAQRIRLVLSQSANDAATFKYWGVTDSYGEIGLLRGIESSATALDAPGVLNVNVDSPSNFSLAMAGLARRSGLVPASPKGGMASQLPADQLNDSRPIDGFFRSPGGQIVTDTVARTMTVNTPRTQALLLPQAGEAAPTGVFRRLRINTPMLVVLSSLDMQPLAQTGKALLMLGSDALNSNMGFDDAGRTTLRRLGNFPLKMPPSQVALGLDLGAATGATATVLGLDGSAQRNVPVSVQNGVLTFELDDVAAASDPTVYVQLQIQR